MLLSRFKWVISSVLEYCVLISWCSGLSCRWFSRVEFLVIVWV